MNKVYKKAEERFQKLAEEVKPLGAPLSFDDMLEASWLLYEVATSKPVKNQKKTNQQMVNELWAVVRKNSYWQWAMQPFVKPLLAYYSRQGRWEDLPTKTKLKKKHEERYQRQFRKAVKCYIDKKNVIIVELEA